MSKIPPVTKVKEPLWTTIRRGWGPYKRLYSYALPYKWRFIIGLGFGFLYGVINGLMPLVMAKVAGVVFQGKGPIAAAGDGAASGAHRLTGPRSAMISSCFVSRSRPL